MQRSSLVYSTTWPLVTEHDLQWTNKVIAAQTQALGDFLRPGLTAGRCQEHVKSRLCTQDKDLTSDFWHWTELYSPLHWVIQCSDQALIITHWTSCFPPPRHAAPQQSPLSLVERQQSLLWLDNTLQNITGRHRATGSMAAPTSGVGKPSAERSLVNTTSFQKKTRSKLISIPGTRPSVQNGQLLVSTGVTSLDYLLGQCNVAAHANGVSRCNGGWAQWSQWRDVSV